uniref:Uncharacterized protein n=1 Tax=Proboscia inermis TaxID=420281 RepID=A0A7S0GIX1_9STRA
MGIKQKACQEENNINTAASDDASISSKKSPNPVSSPTSFAGVASEAVGEAASAAAAAAAMTRDELARLASSSLDAIKGAMGDAIAQYPIAGELIQKVDCSQQVNGSMNYSSAPLQFGGSTSCMTSPTNPPPPSSVVVVADNCKTNNRVEGDAVGIQNWRMTKNIGTELLGSNDDYKSRIRVNNSLIDEDEEQEEHEEY